MTTDTIIIAMITIIIILLFFLLIYSIKTFYFNKSRNIYELEITIRDIIRYLDEQEEDKK